MSGEIDHPLLGRYLFGECSEGERAQVEAWLAANPDHRQRLAELKRVLQVDYPGYPMPDVEAGWQRVRSEVERSDAGRAAPPGAKPAPGRGPVRPEHAKPRPFLRTVALLAVVALAVVLAIRLGAPPATPEEVPPARVYETQPGQRATIELLDGTDVHLNAASRLTVAADFGEGQRAVALEGQAFFEVADDPGRPFLVETAAGLARVVGTAFDVRAYPEEPATRVVVAEGRVAVRATGAAEAEAALLRPEDRAVVAEGDVVVERGVGPGGFLAWREGRLVFEEAPFEEVIAELERWYGLEIEAAVRPGTVLPLNASFEDEPLDNILRTTADLLDLTYRRDGRHVTFSR